MLLIDQSNEESNYCFSLRSCWGGIGGVDNEGASAKFAGDRRVVQFYGEGMFYGSGVKKRDSLQRVPFESSVIRLGCNPVEASFLDGGFAALQVTVTHSTIEVDDRFLDLFEGLQVERSVVDRIQGEDLRGDPFGPINEE